MSKSMFAFVFLALPLCASAQDEVGRKGTVEFLQKLQQADGSFRSSANPKVQMPPSLRATSAAIRALRHFGGDVPTKEVTAKFVASCFDEKSGGFADAPKGKPEVFATAVGLMAVAELKMPMEKYGPAAAKYLGENAKTFEEIRIAVAGLEVLKDKQPDAEKWQGEVSKGQNEDGTFGKGLGQSRETGGRVVALLRLGAKVDQTDTILKVLKEGQRTNGGYGKADSELASELETTYRVLRCFHMLKALPADVEGVRSFVAKCRNEDGGYAVEPGGQSSASGAYYAGTILHWIEKK